MSAPGRRSAFSMGSSCRQSAGGGPIRCASRRCAADPVSCRVRPHVGGIYLGPTNYAAARGLGTRAGKEHGERSSTAELLLVALEALPNTRERVEGFLAGFTETFPGRLVAHRVDGRGVFKEAMRQTMDAFRTRPAVDVVFGVNDHTIFGALEVARKFDAPVAGYSVGGEGAPCLTNSPAADR